MAIIGTYKIININNGKYYYGSSINVHKRLHQHKAELQKNCHHCIHLQRAYNQDGEQSFLFQLDMQYDKEEEARNAEQSILDTNFAELYNVSKFASGGDLISYHPEREKIIVKMKLSLKKRFENMTEEERKRIYGRPGKLNGMYGKTHSEEVKYHLSELNKGNQYMEGYKFTSEHKKKLSDFAKTRTGEKNPFYGKHHSLSAKEKIREKNKGKIPANARKVIIDNNEYISLSEAARALNCSPGTIIYWIKKGKYRYSDEKITAKIAA